MIEGTHKAYIMSHGLGESQRKGTPCVMVKFMVQPDGAEEGPMNHSIWLTDDSMKMARKTLLAMGFNVDERALDELDKDVTLLNGNEVELVLENETYEGKTRLKIKWVNSLGTQKKKWTSSSVASLTESLRAAKEEDEGDEARF